MADEIQGLYYTCVVTIDNIRPERKNLTDCLTTPVQDKVGKYTKATSGITFSLWFIQNSTAINFIFYYLKKQKQRLL